MEAVDERIAAETGVPKQRIAAVAMQDGSTNPGLVLFAEEPPGEWMAKARNLLRADLGPAPRIALVKGARNRDAALRYYDWLMSPQGQQVGARANSLQVPANKTFKPDPRIPSMDGVRLVKYDFEKYGKSAERRRLVDRWTREVEAQPR